MTSDAIKARNRANARQSTGPKSACGKAVVAGNARKHGATARPDPESIELWLAIIMDDPEITTRGFVPLDDLGFKGLALAHAEAKLATTERALQGFHTARTYPRGLEEETLEAMQQFLVAFKQPTNIPRDAQFLDTRPRSATRQDAKDDVPRNLKRYAAEARAQKRKALKAWIAAGGAAHHSRIADQ
jgi:hypothetical protein